MYAIRAAWHRDNLPSNPFRRFTFDLSMHRAMNLLSVHKFWWTGIGKNFQSTKQAQIKSILSNLVNDLNMRCFVHIVHRQLSRSNSLYILTLSCLSICILYKSKTWHLGPMVKGKNSRFSACCLLGQTPRSKVGWLISTW